MDGYGICNHRVSNWNPKDPYEQDMLDLQEGDIPMKAGGIGGWYRDGHQSFENRPIYPL